MLKNLHNGRNVCLKASLGVLSAVKAPYALRTHDTLPPTPLKNFLRHTFQNCLNLLVILIVSIVIAGCQPEPEENGNLNGTWSSSYDSYKIDTSAKTIEYVGNYKADIVNSPDYEAGSGILIVKFTWYYETIYDENWTVISEGVTDVYNGKFGAVYWKGLTNSSVQMADAYDTAVWSRAMYDTLDEAKVNFTSDKTGNYISVWGSYTK